MKFAFLVHPLSSQSLDLLRLDEGGLLHRHWGQADLLTLVREAHGTIRHLDRTSRSRRLAGVRVIDELTCLSALPGARAEGRLYEIPMHAGEILDDPDRALSFMQEAIEMARQWGAPLVGLGSLTGVIGNHGAFLAEHATIAVTTGNSLTVYATLKNLERICQETGFDLRDEVVAVIGIPGSIAAALSSSLALRCQRLLVVARRSAPRTARLAEALGAELLTDIPEALGRARVILSVTSSGDCIDPAWLQPGSVVLDVAVPADVKRTARPRTDVLVLSGGYARMPDPLPHTSAMVSFFQGIIPSCLAETMTLALEQRPECFTLGRELALERVQEIGALAEKHGFELAPLLSYGLAIEDSVLVEFRKVVGRRRRTSRLRPSAPAGQMNGVVSADTGTGASGLPPLSELACRAAMLHGRHLNPVLIALSGNSGLTKTFLRGSGALLHDQEGRSYLDFVSGFGSMNLGHNHPAVVEAVQSALIQQAPGFAQASVNPLAAALAEELVTLAPAGLELVFFTNSGAESVEAALKLARTVTARPGLLSCIGSFHGKTLGALSVTGNPRYQQPFGSLLPDCGAIPFGDLAALEQALRTYHYAAFIVEPIQGEGGMIVPPPGYLAQAQELCHATGTLLIVDEIQTGLGRTGTLFAIESEGVEPDVLTLAKSLGGGLVPIGAMLTRRDLWMKAYGSYQSFLLHTSTFGGGSLACAAGLATLRVLSSSDLIENARQRGEQLLQGLTALCQRSSKLHEVRGRGLMLGLEFTPPSPALKHHFQRTGGLNAAWALIPNYPELVASLPSAYIMSTLLQEHGIYTQVARSNPLVLRIQPPLIITQSQVDRFLEALEQTCSELDYFSQALNTILAKSIGEHEPI